MLFGSTASPTILPQTAGTVFAYGFQLKVRDLTSVLDGALSSLGLITANGGISSAGAIAATGATGTITAAGLITANANMNVIGTVGINTATPQSALQVVGAKIAIPTTAGIHMGHISGNYGIELCAAAATNNTYIDFTYPTSDYRGRILYNNATTAMSFNTDAIDVVPQLYINSLGMVGIGTSSPTFRLHVIGGAFISQYLQIAGGLFTGAPYMYSGQLNGTVSYAAGAPLEYLKNGGINPGTNYDTGNLVFT